MGKPDRMAVLGLGALIAFFNDNAFFNHTPGTVMNWTLGVIAVGSLLTAINRYRKARGELEGAV
jgi:hypothetical protein